MQAFPKSEVIKCVRWNGENYKDWVWFIKDRGELWKDCTIRYDGEWIMRLSNTYKTLQIGDVLLGYKRPVIVSEQEFKDSYLVHHNS